MNPIPPTIEVNTRAKALAVRTDPLRTKARGTKGAFDRDSMNRKSPRTRTDAARGMKVHSDAKPTPAALVSPKTSRMIPVVLVSAPGISRCWFFSQPPPPGKYLWQRSAATIPIGTLMNITHLQPKNVVKAPPATAPAANPPERVATRYPRALFLSGPSVKILMKIAKAVTVVIAAPMP